MPQHRVLYLFSCLAWRSHSIFHVQLRHQLILRIQVIFRQLNITAHSLSQKTECVQACPEAHDPPQLAARFSKLLVFCRERNFDEGSSSFTDYILTEKPEQAIRQSFFAQELFEEFLRLIERRIFYHSMHPGALLQASARPANPSLQFCFAQSRLTGFQFLLDRHGSQFSCPADAEWCCFGAGAV